MRQFNKNLGDNGLTSIYPATRMKEYLHMPDKLHQKITTRATFRETVLDPNEFSALDAESVG